jgi:hypothetical protein
MIRQENTVIREFKQKNTLRKVKSIDEIDFEIKKQMGVKIVINMFIKI